MMPVEMTVGRRYFAAAVHGDNLYAISGFNTDAAHTKHKTPRAGYLQ
jgi:hypothetical protein